MGLESKVIVNSFHPVAPGTTPENREWLRERSSFQESLRQVRAEIFRSGKILGANGTSVEVWPIGLTDSRGQILRELVVREQAKSCIETGMAYGMSTSFLMEGCLESHCQRPSHSDPLVTSIDPFETSQWGSAGKLQLKNASVEKFHALHEMCSELVLPRLVLNKESFDFAFVDGDHRFEHAVLDIFYFRRLLGPDRLIVVDDAWMPSVQKACHFFVSADLCKAETYGLGDAEAKFIVLRVTSKGDCREWDHFRDF